MSLIFQALQYDFRDHFFGEPTGNRNEDNLYKEIVFTLHGNRQNDGESVAVGIRGFKLHIYLQIHAEDISFTSNTTIDLPSTLKNCQKKLRSLVHDIFATPDWKRPFKEHVLIDETVLEEKRSVFPFQEKASVFLKVPFRSAAAFHHFVRTIRCVQTVQQNHHHNETSLKIEIDKVKQRIKRSTIAKENKKHNGTKASATQKGVILTKNQEENLTIKKDELERLQNAFQQNSKLSSKLQTMKWTLFNSKIDIMLLFLKEIQCRTQWFEIKMNDLTKSILHSNVAEPGHIGLKAKHIGVVNIHSLIPRNDIDTIAPFLQCSFDIEAYSDCYMKDASGEYLRDKKNDKIRAFPKPNIPQNVCFQISMHLHRFGQPLNTARNHLITLGNPEPLPQESENTKPEDRITVHRMNSERDLLIKFFQMVHDHDIDVFLSYNGDGFDWQYIYHRAVLCRLLDEKRKFFIKDDDEDNDEGTSRYTHTVESGMATDLLTREPGETVQLEYSVFSSGAAGTTSYRRLNIPGRLHIDLMKYMHDSEKLDR